jgi:hypothetical protein
VEPPDLAKLTGEQMEILGEAAASKASAGLIGGLAGGIAAVLVKPPQKIKLFRGHAIKDDFGKIVMEHDGVAAVRVVLASGILGFAEAFITLKYLSWDWDALSIIALAAMYGLPSVAVAVWVLNTLHLRSNTDLINAAVQLKFSLIQGVVQAPELPSNQSK